MAKANHYCADCDTNFKCSLEQHAKTYHNNGFFRGVKNGNYFDWKSKQRN